MKSSQAAGERRDCLLEDAERRFGSMRRRGEPISGATKDDVFNSSANSNALGSPKVLEADYAV